MRAFEAQGFKFRQQLNEYNEETGQTKRRIIYGYNRPKDIVAPIIERQEEPIILKVLTILGSRGLGVSYKNNFIHSNEKCCFHILHQVLYFRCLY